MCKKDFALRRLPAPNRVLNSSFGQGNVGSACFFWKEKNHRSCLPFSPPWRPDFFRMSGHLLLLLKEGRCCCFSSIPSFSSPLLLAPFACAQSHAISEKSHSETARRERRKKFGLLSVPAKPPHINPSLLVCTCPGDSRSSSLEKLRSFFPGKNQQNSAGAYFSTDPPLLCRTLFRGPKEKHLGSVKKVESLCRARRITTSREKSGSQVTARA